MAVTYANREIIFRGSVTLMYVEITLDSSYLTGGEAINASDFGFGMILNIWPASADGFNVDYIKTNPTTGLLKAFANSASTNTVTEFASALDRSGVTINALVVGR